MNQLRLYEIYVAVSLHFSNKGSYDYFKYKGKTKVTEDAFIKRNDKYMFEKYAKKFQTDDDAALFFAVNIFNNIPYIRNMSDELYDQFISYRDAIHYNFKQQTNKLICFDLYSIINKDISPEFLVIYDYCSNGALFRQLDMTSDIMWIDYKNQLLKYYPFIVKYMNLSSYKKDLSYIILE